MVCDCERVSFPDIRTSFVSRTHTAELQQFSQTTMRCSGSSKCDCTLFNGGPRAKRCRSCSHNRGSHYEPRDDDSSSGDHNDSSNDTNDDDDTDENDNDHKPPLAVMKNKMTVSSLVADLINSGEHSRVEVGNAQREARAGLTKRQVCSIFEIRRKI